VAAQEKHERPVDASLNDAAVQRAVHIDGCLATWNPESRIVQLSRRRKSGQILPRASCRAVP